MMDLPIASVQRALIVAHRGDKNVPVWTEWEAQMPNVKELEEAKLEITKSMDELTRQLKREAFGEDAQRAGDHVLLALTSGMDLLEKAVEEWLASVQKNCANDR
jgi:malate/lactate dehydrogenase